MNYQTISAIWQTGNRLPIFLFILSRNIESTETTVSYAGKSQPVAITVVAFVSCV